MVAVRVDLLNRPGTLHGFAMPLSLAQAVERGALLMPPPPSHSICRDGFGAPKEVGVNSISTKNTSSK